MDYILKSVDGIVKYIYRAKDMVVGSSTREEAAKEMLSRGQPYKSSDFKDYPIALNEGDDEYFFAGTWQDESIFVSEPKPKRKNGSVLTK